MVHKLILQVGFFSYAQIYVSMLNFTSAGSNVNLSQKKSEMKQQFILKKKKKRRKERKITFFQQK